MAALVVLWHCTQLALVEGALAWMSAMVGMTEKSATVWHAVQLALAEVGMWLAGLEGEVKSLKLAWQFEQSPVVGCLLSATKKVPAVACGRVWKPLNGAAVLMGYWPMLIHT